MVMKKKYSEKYRTGEHSLSATQVKKLLNTFDSIFEKAIIHLALGIGLRRKDVVNVKRNDYDEETGMITYFEHKKSKTRTVKIPSDEVRNTLNMYLKIRDLKHPNNKWLFPSPVNSEKFRLSHISDRQIYTIFNDHLEIAGISKRPFHACRATCIKMCELAAWKDFQTAALVGDKVSTIQEHYLTPSRSEMIEIADDKQIM